MTGADDPNVPPAQVSGFVEEMKKAVVSYEVDVYSGAAPSFTNADCDNLGIAGIGYSRRADERSWERMKSFLWRFFANRPAYQDLQFQ